jgi:hypothetical protein
MMLHKRDKLVNKKWNSMSYTHTALLLAALWTSPGFANVVSESQADRVDEGANASQAVAAWQEYAVYLISRQLCGSSANSDQIWPEHACASILAEVFAEMAARPAAGMPDGQYLYSLYSLQNYDWSQDSPSTGFAFDSGALFAEARSSIPDLSHQQDKLVADVDVQPVELNSRDENVPSVSATGGAIPGSLLVTILALVGIVAVARRDVSGKDGARSVVDSGSEAANVASPRPNADPLNSGA